MSKIYLASSWRNPDQQRAVSDLRSAGHEVYDFRNPPDGIPNGFRWSEIDPNWEAWSAAVYREKLKSPLAQDGFRSDFTGMKWADVGILFLPCGKSAHLEIGWMAGAGKRTIVWTRDGQEPELMALLASEICVSLDEVLAALAAAPPPPPLSPDDAMVAEHDAIYALAAAWASIDGKLEEFAAGKDAKSLDDEPGGHYSGYICDAEEMIERLRNRGFDVLPRAAIAALAKEGG